MTKNKLAELCSQKYNVSVSTAKRAIDKIQGNRDLIADDFLDDLEQALKEKEKTKDNPVNIKYYTLPLTLGFNWLFDSAIHEVKSIPGYSYVEYSDQTLQISYDVSNDDDTFKNPLQVPRWKWYYSAICSMFGLHDVRMRISMENLYRVISNHKGAINKDSLKAFQNDFEAFLSVIKKIKVKVLDKSFPALVVDAKGAELDIVIPALLINARKYHRVAGIKAEYLGTGQTNSIPQRAYLSLRIAQAKNKNNKMKNRIKSETLKAVSGSDSMKVTRKYLQEMKSLELIKEYSIKTQGDNYIIDFQ